MSLKARAQSVTDTVFFFRQYFGIIYDEFSVNIHIEIYPFDNKTEEKNSDFITEENMDKEKIFEDGQYSNLNYAIIGKLFKQF